MGEMEGWHVQRTAWRPGWLEQGGSQVVGDMERDQMKGRIMEDLVDRCEGAISQWKGRQRQLCENPGLGIIVAQTSMAAVEMVWGAHTWICTSLKHFLSASHIPSNCTQLQNLAWIPCIKALDSLDQWLKLLKLSFYWNWELPLPKYAHECSQVKLTSRILTMAQATLPLAGCVCGDLNSLNPTSSNCLRANVTVHKR